MDYLVGGLGIFCKVISFSIRTSIKTSKLAWQNGGKKISLMTVQGLNKGILKTYHLGKRAIIDSREKARNLYTRIKSINPLKKRNWTSFSNNVQEKRKKSICKKCFKENIHF